MISAWHSLWIVPVSVWVGMFIIALVSGNRDDRGENGH